MADRRIIPPAEAREWLEDNGPFPLRPGMLNLLHTAVVLGEEVETLRVKVSEQEAALAEAWDEGWESGATCAVADEQGYSEDSEAHAKETNPYRAPLAGEQPSLTELERQHRDDIDSYDCDPAICSVHNPLAGEQSDTQRVDATHGESLPTYEHRGLARPSDRPWRPAQTRCGCGCPTYSAHLRMIGAAALNLFQLLQEEVRDHG
jgi:hypothetical protein